MCESGFENLCPTLYYALPLFGVLPMPYLCPTYPTCPTISTMPYLPILTRTNTVGSEEAPQVKKYTSTIVELVPERIKSSTDRCKLSKNCRPKIPTKLMGLTQKKTPCPTSDYALPHFGSLTYALPPMVGQVGQCPIHTLTSQVLFRDPLP